MGIISLRGIEDARKIVSYAFSDCKDLRTIAVLARCMRCGMRWRRTFECEQKERAPLTLCQSFGRVSDEGQEEHIRVLLITLLLTPSIPLATTTHR
jgi:hypothetical protein